MFNEGVIDEYPEYPNNRNRVRRMGDVLSDDNREYIETKIFVSELLEELYPKYHTEIEMLILSISNYTHREISEVLNISRLGVTKRIGKAREVLKEQYDIMLGGV